MGLEAELRVWGWSLAGRMLEAECEGWGRGLRVRGQGYGFGGGAAI